MYTHRKAWKGGEKKAISSGKVKNLPIHAIKMKWTRGQTDPAVTWLHVHWRTKKNPFCWSRRSQPIYTCVHV